MPSDASEERRVWDLPTRIVHWLLVLAVSGSWITSEMGASYFTYHVYCGYTVLLAVVFRVIWGFVGTRYARFRDFLRGPVQVVRYVRGLLSGASSPTTIGHNPLGGWSIVVLLALLLTQASTGLFANDEIDNTGPFFGWVSEHWSNRLSGYHRRIFDLIKIAVALHLLAVGYYAWGRGENLVRPMITGRKSASGVPVQAQIGGSRIRLALTIVLLLAAALALAVHLAPEASLSVF